MRNFFQDQYSKSSMCSSRTGSETVSDLTKLRKEVNRQARVQSQVCLTPETRVVKKNQHAPTIKHFYHYRMEQQ